MDEQPFETTYPEPEQVSGIAGEINGQSVTFGPGLVGIIRAEQDASLTRGGALVVAAGKDVEMSGGGAGLVASGRDFDLQNGGAWVTVIGHDGQVTNGGAIVKKRAPASQVPARRRVGRLPSSGEGDHAGRWRRA